MLRRLIEALTLIGLLLVSASAASRDQGATAEGRYFISLGTGPVSGLYYSIGRSICQLGDRAFVDRGLYCSAEPTMGSSYNVDRLAAGQLDFAFVQSDVQFEASTGKGFWSGRQVDSLRSVMSLYAELFTILGRREANLSGPGFLSGKRINIGPPGSGTRASWEELEPSLGLTKDKLGLVMEIPSESATPLLCTNELDASIWMIGHPSKLIDEQLRRCDLMVFGVTGPAVDKMISARPYLVKGIIPGHPYGLPSDIGSFGVKATILTTEGVSAAVVHDFTRAILANLEGLQRSQPALAGIDVKAMVHSGVTAPVHPGALKAFKELGLVN